MQEDTRNTQMAGLWSKGRVEVHSAKEWFTDLANSVIWKKYLFWKNKLNLLGHSKVIEAGCGYGKFSLLLGLIGEKTTLLDYNKGALNSALEIHRCFNLAPQCETGDLIELSYRLKEQYDVVCSFGVLEHFSGKHRLCAFQANARFLRPGGLLFFSVPNRFALFYRIAFGLRRIMGVTPKSFYEKQYSRSELKSLASLSGIKVLEIEGSGKIKDDLRYWIGENIKSSIRKIFGIKKAFSGGLGDSHPDDIDLSGSHIKDTRNYLDKLFSYNLLFIGQKR